jgi:hypothetical protein
MSFSLSKLKHYFGFSKSVLARQLEDHKYFLNEKTPREISMEEAFDSWNKTVFLPMVDAIEAEGLIKKFPGVSANKLFVRISEHWYFLKKEGNVTMTAREAAQSYAENFAMPETRPKDAKD